jgi:hypothetical protein
MPNKRFSVSCMLMTMALLVTVSAAFAVAQELTGEPDKTMAAAQESFAKKDTKKAAEYLQKSATYVRQEAVKVTASAKAGMMKAGDALDQLGKDVSKGAVKSADEMKKVFASVDHERAKAWHATAAAAQKTGKDSTDMLKRGGAALNGAAQWSGSKLKEGASMAVDGAKKIGQGAKMGAAEVEKTFKGLGEGIEDVGRRLGGS